MRDIEKSGVSGSLLILKTNNAIKRSFYQNLLKLLNIMVIRSQASSRG
jgi:hypothetical protein